MERDIDTPRELVSVGLARRLRDAGLVWHPREGDFFHIPDRGLDDRVFSISKMVVEVRDVLGDRELAFNGTVEWALDSILKTEVVWVPTEGQLRHEIGKGFVALHTEDDGRFTCVVRVAGTPSSFSADTGPDAYAYALLAMMS